MSVKEVFHLSPLGRAEGAGGPGGLGGRKVPDNKKALAYLVAFPWRRS